MRHYRYQDRLYCSGLDEWGNSMGTSVKVEMREFRTLAETPCGYWIALDFLGDGFIGPKYFVLKNSRKRYAWPTKEEALTSFIERKKKQISILNHQLDHAKTALQIGYSFQAELKE